MAWEVSFKESAKKQLFKLDRQWQEAILDYLDVIASLHNPESRGKPLKGDKKGFWRYRLGDYRILCHINQDEKIIVVLVVGHRREVYDD